MAPNATDHLTTGRQSLEFSAIKSAKASTWGSTFPEQFESQEDSSKFMDRCLLLAMSQLLYSRKLLPLTAFKKRVVTDIVRCQVPNPSDRIGRRLLEKLRGAGEAMKHGYLNEFIIVIGTNNDDPDDAVEVFIWTMRYNEDGGSYLFLSNERGEALAKIEYKGPEHVKEQTRLLLLRIRKLCADVLAPLPRDAFPTFRVTYTNDTPKGYQAPGFYRSPTLYDLHHDARSLDIGGVATGKHKFLLSVDSVYIGDETTARNAVALTNDDMVSDVSSIQDVSFLGDAANINGADIEEPRFVPIEEASPMPEEKIETKKTVLRSRESKKAPKGSAEKVPRPVRARKTKAVEEPEEPVPAKKSPGFSGKMTENTPTNSPPRNR